MNEQSKERGVKNPMRHSVPHSPESELLGKSLEDAPELLKEAESRSFVSSEAPPFLLQHGLEDNPVPHQGSILLATKLGNVLGYGKMFLKLFPATGHGGEAFRTKENRERIFRFLDTYLKQ